MKVLLTIIDWISSIMAALFIAPVILALIIDRGALEGLNWIKWSVYVFIFLSISILSFNARKQLREQE